VAAHDTATRLGAEPLRREIEALARRARLQLEPDGSAPPAPPPAPQTAFGLTAREEEVLLRIAHGDTNRKIAKTLFISEKTVSIHVSRILAKMGVPNRAAAAATAHRLGLLEPR
jgi:DNA-binding NarL/FixJ family response regulator